MGVYLVPELLDAGFEVLITSRSAHNSDNPRLRYFQGDARDTLFLREILSKTTPDAIVDFMLYSTAEFHARRDLLLGSTDHYLFISSYRVFANSSPYPLTERSPRLLDVCDDEEYLATDEYALSKARQENLLRDSGKGNWTILRPCITYSRNRFQFGTLEANTVCYRAMQGLPVLMAREILAKQTTMTWAGDAAKLIAHLVLKESALSEDYNVVTAEHQPWAVIAGYYTEFLNLRVIETDLFTYSKIVGGPEQIKYDRMFDRVMDNAKVIAATGISQLDFTLLRDGLERELVGFKKKPVFKSPNFVLNARMDKATGTRISLAGLTYQNKLSYWVGSHPAVKKTCPKICDYASIFCYSLDRLAGKHAGR